MASKPDPRDLWIQHQPKSTKSKTWACIYCPSSSTFNSEEDLWEHAKVDHHEQISAHEGNLEAFRESFAAESAQKRPTKDSSQTRKPDLNEGNGAQCEPHSDQGKGKRPLEPTRRPQPTRSISLIGALDINTPRSSDDVQVQDPRDDSQDAEECRPPKRAAVGDGISAGSGSPFRDSSPSSSPRRSKARPTGQFDSSPNTDNLPRNMLDTPGRPPTGKRQLWQEGQAGPTKSSFNDPSNIASIAAQKARAQQHHPKNRKPFQPPPPSFQSPRPQVPQNITSPGRHVSTLENYEIVLQPETRPISQEQLVAEVKGIYAGLVMVEAKCIEVDNKQATLAQANPEAQPKLDNEQWQALIALHRTLLHEHHDFFLASQHPSASPALRRLASKYAMPARMWRHGIHSFLELLRHRLPASLDHMLAFIYLAYSMMALLYETVPAFEDTWIECLGDLGRYRMAIEDDDIRDREVWTGVARHWYSKASDKAPTTGRLYHHLAILARPNALQQLFYYAKSLCVVIPFTSARESILTLFDPVLNADNHQGQYRLPPLDTSFVKAHGLLFTNKNMEKFEPTVKEFISLLDSQIGRVTRKFMEQGYHIAVANRVAMLGFASKDNILMKAYSSSDVEISTSDHTPQSLSSFRNAQRLTNDTLKIVLQRIGDPNALALIRVTLVFMQYISRHPSSPGVENPLADHTSRSSLISTLLEQNSLNVQLEPFPQILDPGSKPKPCHDKIQSQVLPCKCPGSHSNLVTEDPSPPSISKRRSSIFQKLQGYARGIGIATLCAQIKIVSAAHNAVTENQSRHMLQLILEPAAPAAELAVALGVGVMGARFIQRYWDVDLCLLLDFFFNLGILILSQDPRFSDGELYVLCFYGAATNFHWMKNKLVKLPKTGGVTALGIGSLGIYSSWKITHQFPALEARFDNQFIPKAIASLPTTTGYSLGWAAIFEQTGLAKAIETRIDDPQFWKFILGILRAFLIHFFARGIQVFMERFFGRVDAGFQNNLFQGLAQDVEADPRAPWNEPFRGPGNQNNMFRGPQDVEADPRAYFPRNEPFRGPDNENFYRQEREEGNDNENFYRQHNEDGPDNHGFYREESEDGLPDRGESPLRQY